MNTDPAMLKQKYEPKQSGQITPDRQICRIRMSPCGKYLLAACTDATVRRWDMTAEKPEELSPLAGHNGWVQSVEFAHQGDRFYSVDSWGQLRAWSFAQREAKLLWSHEHAHDGWIRGLAVSSDEKRLATCGFDQVVRIWSAEDGAKQHELTGHKEDVFSVAFDPTGQSLLSGDLKGVIKQWNVADGKPLREFDAKSLYQLSRLQDVGGVRTLAFDPAGELLAAGGLLPSSGGNVQGIPAILLFDAASGELKQTLKVGANGDGFVYDIHFHADGFLMAVSSGNPGKGNLFFQRPGDEQPFVQVAKMANCHSLAVHPDGKRLIVSATNTGSNGNGRQLKDGKYRGNFSPLYLLEMPG